MNISYLNHPLIGSGEGAARYVVIPAGINFFHITEWATGRVKGFRRRHNDACALARALER